MTFIRPLTLLLGAAALLAIAAEAPAAGHQSKAPGGFFRPCGCEIWQPGQKEPSRKCGKYGYYKQDPAYCGKCVWMVQNSKGDFIASGCGTREDALRMAQSHLAIYSGYCKVMHQPMEWTSFGEPFCQGCCDIFNKPNVTPQQEAQVRVIEGSISEWANLLFEAGANLGQVISKNPNFFAGLTGGLRLPCRGYLTNLRDAYNNLVRLRRDLNNFMRRADLTLTLDELLRRTQDTRQYINRFQDSYAKLPPELRKALESGVLPGEESVDVVETIKVPNSMCTYIGGCRGPEPGFKEISKLLAIRWFEWSDIRETSFDCRLTEFFLQNLSDKWLIVVTSLYPNFREYPRPGSPGPIRGHDMAVFLRPNEKEDGRRDLRDELGTYACNTGPYGGGSLAKPPPFLYIRARPLTDNERAALEKWCKEDPGRSWHFWQSTHSLFLQLAHGEPSRKPAADEGEGTQPGTAKPTAPQPTLVADAGTGKQPSTGEPTPPQPPGPPTPQPAATQPQAGPPPLPQWPPLPALPSGTGLAAAVESAHKRTDYGTQEPPKEVPKEPPKEPAKEPAKESAEVALKEPPKEAPKEPPKEPAKEQAKEPPKAATRRETGDEAQGVALGAALKRADDLLREGKAQEALAAAQEAMRLDPSRFQGYNYAAYALYRLDLPDEADALVKKALDRAPEEAKGTVKELADAIAAKRSVLPLLKAGNEALADGLRAKAARQFAKAWDGAPKLGEVGLKAAQLFFDIQEHVECAKVLHRLIADSKDPALVAPAQELLAQCKPALDKAFQEGYELAEGQLKQGQPALALQAARQLADSFPTRFEPHVLLARIHASQKELPSALRDFQQAAKNGLKSVDELIKGAEIAPLLSDKNFLEFVNESFGESGVIAAKVKWAETAPVLAERVKRAEELVKSHPAVAAFRAAHKAAMDAQLKPAQADANEYEEANRKIAEILNTKILTFDFIDTPLTDALGFVQAKLGVNMIVDPDLPKGRTVTLKCGDMVARDALKWLLRISEAKMEVTDGIIHVSPDKKRRRGYEVPENF